MIINKDGTMIIVNEDQISPKRNFCVCGGQLDFVTGYNSIMTFAHKCSGCGSIKMLYNIFAGDPIFKS